MGSVSIRPPGPNKMNTFFIQSNTRLEVVKNAYFHLYGKRGAFAMNSSDIPIDIR